MTSASPKARGKSAPDARSGSDGQRERADAGADAARQAPDRLCHAHYRSLVRLAALLTGDALLADQIAADSLVAVINWQDGTRDPERELLRLRQQVVARSRRKARLHGCVTDVPGQEADGSAEAASAVGELAVIRTLLSLPVRQREAVVLTFYVDLGESDAAAVMATSERTVQRLLENSRAALAAVTDSHPGMSA
jgi:DNA-directed RNA polymerase specialized sigma24 family protein